VRVGWVRGSPLMFRLWVSAETLIGLLE